MVQLKQFGKYEIVRKLGRSMTDVYLAHDPECDRQAVLKIIEESGDEYTETLIEAELRGAQIQSQLHQLDPRIIEIYEYGRREGCFFVSMAYFEGRNIAELLHAEQRLEPMRAVRYAAEVCSQLDRLHSFVSDVDGRQRAVVHGDIKPSNIQIGPGDEVRLLDFGIAKVITYTHNLTHHNLGSPTYCSPERLSKGQVDPQSDLWALGVSLYEMVGGAPPYQAQDTRKLENLIQSKRPPRALPADCPPRVRAVIQKALAPDLRRRYASAAAFESDLRAILLNFPTAAETEPQSTFPANATIQKSPPEPLPKTVAVSSPRRKPAKPARRSRGVGIAMGAGMMCGFLLAPMYYLNGFRNESKPLRPPLTLVHASLGQIQQDWQLYQKLRRENAFLGRFSPAAPLAAPFRLALTDAAEEEIERYRNSSDSSIAHFDWNKSAQCLRYALEIDPTDIAAKGRLALCNGYLNLVRNPKLPGAAQSEANFLAAARALPRSPDPHLALAHLYAYSFGNAGKAAAELTAAERDGFHNGPREFEAQGDAYLARAEYELRQARRAVPRRPEENEWLSVAGEDLKRARALYEPIAGYDRVSTNLHTLDRDSRQQRKMLAAETVKPHRTARKVRSAKHRPARKTKHHKLWL